MKLFLITSKDYCFSTKAKDYTEAWQHFFQSIKQDEKRLGQIGQLAMLREEGKESEAESRPMRLVPALFKGKLIDKKTAVQNISRVTGADSSEAEEMLLKMSAKDAWVWEES